jgi:hypothetical protein
VDIGLGLVVAVLAYALSCAILAPGPTALTFGAEWQKQSMAPFDLPGQFPQRILAPLLAWFLGLGGDHFVLFVRGLAMLLLATVFLFARRHGARPIDAALVTVAIALTAAIQMYKQHWVGFVDPLCYTLFFAMWLAERRAVLFWVLFGANLFNHELAAFLLPWAWWLRRRAGGDWRGDVVGAGVAIALYAAFYLWVKANAPAQAYSYEYFATHPLFPGGTFVVVLLALSHWVVAFGPVLAVLGWHWHLRRPPGERFHLTWVVAGILVIFGIAFDWARHANLVILPLALASVRFLAAGKRVAYVGLVVLGAGLMLWIPPWLPSSWPVAAMADMPLWINTGVVVMENGDYFPGSLTSATTRWLPVVAPMLATVLGIGAAIWGVGWLLARRDSTATSDRAASAAP